jgi:hypothetical protein
MAYPMNVNPSEPFGSMALWNEQGEENEQYRSLRDLR